VTALHRRRTNEGEQKMSAKQIMVHESSSNIFADLGLPDADNHLNL
jgi:hypothetical protein